MVQAEHPQRGDGVAQEEGQEHEVALPVHFRDQRRVEVVAQKERERIGSGYEEEVHREDREGTDAPVAVAREGTGAGRVAADLLSLLVALLEGQFLTPRLYARA